MMPSFWLPDIYKSGKHETQLNATILGWIFFRWLENSHCYENFNTSDKTVSGSTILWMGMQSFSVLKLRNQRQQEILQSLNCSIHYLSVIFCNSSRCHSPNLRELARWLFYFMILELHQRFISFRDCCMLWHFWRAQINTKKLMTTDDDL